MRRRLMLLILVGCSCGRTLLSIDLDGGDAGGVVAGPDAGPPDAGPSVCVPLAVIPGMLNPLGPRITLPADNPKMLDGVMTPAGRVFAVLDPANKRVLVLGPGWEREVAETTAELFRVHLAWNGSQLALTWQADRRLMFALFDAQGLLQHRRELANTTQPDEAVAGFAAGTWVAVWTHGITAISDAWATRIAPDGGDQTLAQKVTNQPLKVGFPASGISAIVSDAGISALVLGAEYSALAFTNLQPTHQREVSVPGSRGRGALVSLGNGQLSAVFYGEGPNGRRPDLTRIDFRPDGGQTSGVVASQPSLFTIEDLAAMECAGRLVVAFTDDTTGQGPCIGDYCARPLIHVATGVDGGDWHSSETDGGYARSVTVLRNGNSLDVAWLSASSDGTAQVVVASAIVSCCGP